MKKSKVKYASEPGMLPMKQPSRVRISGPHARKLMSGMGVGKKGTFKMGGKIRALSSNDYDDSIEMDLDDCEHCEEMPKSLSGAMKHRKRHMASGKYTA